MWNSSNLVKEWRQDKNVLPSMAKARTLQKMVPRNDYLMYTRCESEVQTIAALAKCVVKLLDARDRSKLHRFSNSDQRSSASKLLYSIVPGFKYFNTEVRNWLEQLQKWLPEIAEKDKRIKQQNLQSDIIRYQSDVQQNIESSLDHQFIKSYNSGENNERAFAAKEYYHFSVLNLLELFSRNSTMTKFAPTYIASLFGINNSQRLEMKNVKQLRMICDYYNKVDKVNKFMQSVSTLNTKFLRNVYLSIESHVERLKSATDEPLLRDVLERINSFQQKIKGKSISLMSPHFLSIIPDRGDQNHRILSPTIFSFQREGLLSLHDLYELVIGSEMNIEHYLLELILELSGAAQAVQKIIDTTEGSRKEMENIVYPTVLKLIALQKNWEEALNSYSEQQRVDLKEKGYSYLTTKQLCLIYGNDVARKLNLDESAYTAMNDVEKEEIIEAKIRALAHATEQIMSNIPKIPEGRIKRHTSQTITFHTFKAVAFSSYVGYGSALDMITLSPHAFILELFHPQAFFIRTLSPSAFVASILSPTALTATILSPTAFGIDVLSPRALSALVLSPRALITAVLSPHLIHSRVLSPETLIIEVLTPDILSPSVGSGGSYSIHVLSPKVLSPQIWSKNSMILEILSPHILGGDDSEDSDEKSSNKAATNSNHEERNTLTQTNDVMPT